MTHTAWAMLGGLLIGFGSTTGWAAMSPAMACSLVATDMVREICPSALAQAADNGPSPVTSEPSPALNLPPEILDSSPVLQDWLEEIPDIADEIRNEPSFRTRLRAGYVLYPSTQQTGGVGVGVEDVFLLPGSALTVSGHYDRSTADSRETYGAEARYYLLPLGGYVNVAPALGYQALRTPNYSTDGVSVGFQLLVVPSRGGGADVAISQHWVAPGSVEEVGLTEFSVGYALTQRLRISSDWQVQKSRFGQESRLGLGLELLM